MKLFEDLKHVTFKHGHAYCSEHGAMNKVSKHGMWRCLVCHCGFDEKTHTVYKSSSEGFRK